jgi:two-component system, OmpR family, response regulator
METHSKQVGRVLVVDDDRTMRVLLSAFLRAGGHEVEAVATGLEALAAAGARPPDLVLVDYMMADLCGPEVVRRLRLDPRMLGVPFVMLTASELSASVEEAARAGASDYLRKPIDRRTLLDRVQAALESRPCRRPSAAPHATLRSETT